MKLINKLFGLLVVVLVILSCGSKEQQANHAEYTCPMHPTVVSDRPSTCPVCGMDLVRKAAPGEEVEITGELRQLIESPGRSVISSIKTVSPTFSALPVEIQASGVITYDPRNVYTIPSRTTGRIEKMYVTSEFQQVEKGQIVAGIYSPELVSAQRELVYLLEQDSNNNSLIEAATEKLKLLGLSVSEINDIKSKRRVQEIIPVYSPYVGFLISGNVEANTANAKKTTGMDVMNNNSPNALAGSESKLLREGDYVNVGQTLVSLVNNQSLLVELDVPAEHSDLVHPGSKVRINIGEKEYAAEVIFVQPYFNEGKNFLNVRLYFDGTDLHVGQFVRARLRQEGKEKVWIPREALLYLGNADVVFVKEREVFKPRVVTTGMRTESHVEIVAGLATSEVIASNASFMVDSDSFIK